MFEKLENILDYHFKNQQLLKQALTHSSITSHIGSNYERLEFLGDRILGVGIAGTLYKEFPQEPEGSLSPRHMHLVCKETVSVVAKQLQLDKYIFVATEDIRENENVLCDVCEAVIGAICIDSDIDQALSFVNKHWKKLIHQDMTPPKDFKTRLQELAHAHGYQTPTYEVISRTGSEHEPTFTIEVKIDNLPPQAGSGHNKKLAEQAAAAKMIALMEKR
ncbi:MAG: ribonuclease III [Alphaproteobacteria bacterium]|nr:ribonuclease III [Alphaproteobacteria bacterium]